MGNADAYSKMGCIDEITMYPYNRLSWLREGENNGSSLALYNLSNQLIDMEEEVLNKIGVSKALKYIISGADTGADGINILGYCYREKCGLHMRNYELAIKCFNYSAKKSNAYAMYNLGKVYENGYGVSVNYNAAAKWYLLADKNGHEDAIKEYDKLYRENKIRRQNKVTANKEIQKPDVSMFRERINTHINSGYYSDAATNIRHIEETILSYFVQVFIPECIFDNKGIQKKKLSEMNAIPEHYIKILYSIGKIGNSGAHANGNTGESLTKKDIVKFLAPIDDLIDYYKSA